MSANDAIGIATYSITSGDSGEQASIFFTDGSTETVNDRHPNFAEIIGALVSKPEGYEQSVYDLANISATVARKFQDLSDRVTTDGTDIFFDGDPIHNALSQEIIKRLREDAQRAANFFSGKGDADSIRSEKSWQALVKFLENLQQNPNENSRESLYRFIIKHGLTIDKDGYLIAYKGLEADFGSVNKGYGIVDGEEVNGTLYNKPGSVIRFPRKDVDSNSAVGCSQGLHAGTHAYASGWNRGKLVAVRINPRDVVSVPDDSSFSKLRTCQYEVLHEVDPLEDAVATTGDTSATYWDWDEDDYDDSSEWEDPEDSYEGYEDHYGSEEDEAEASYDSSDFSVDEVVSFGYTSLTGDYQEVVDARVEEIYPGDIVAFVPSKDGFRTFKYEGITDLTTGASAEEPEVEADGEDQEAPEIKITPASLAIGVGDTVNVTLKDGKTIANAQVLLANESAVTLRVIGGSYEIVAPDEIGTIAKI